MTTLQPPRSKELEALSVKATRAFVESGLHGIEAEVVVVLDVSPRMAPLYLDGSLQQLATQLLALAMKFDDDGVVPIWTFSDEARHVGHLRRDDYVAWVDRTLQAPPLMRPGMRVPPSRYSPFIDAIAQRYFPREWSTPPKTHQVGGKLKRTVYEYARLLEPRPCPIFVIVVTSGDCEDPLETSRQLRRASHLPIFWQFAAVSPTEGQRHEFRFLRGIDKLTDTHVDACGFFDAGMIGDPDHLYQGLLGEFQGYLELPEVQAMLIESAPVAAPPTESAQGVERHVLSLPESEALRREHARLERERRRAERDAANEAELARVAAYPKVSPEAEVGDAAAEGSDTSPDAARPTPSPHPPATTRPAPRLKRETLPYGHHIDDDEDAAPSPPARLAAAAPQPPRKSTAPAAGAAPAVATPTPGAKLRSDTRAFDRFEPPVALPRAPELAPAPPADDDDDLEDTVETAAERLQRIRARREARKGLARSDD